VAVFLVGVGAAMVLTQHLRSEGTVVSQIVFRVDNGPRYRVCFQTPRDDTFDVAIVDTEGAAVRVLAAGRALEGTTSPDKASANCFDWDGLTSAGTPAPPGNYRLRLDLAEAERRLVSGEKLKITEEAPLPAEKDGPAP
jgi:hypothetical protein